MQTRVEGCALVRPGELGLGTKTPPSRMTFAVERSTETADDDGVVENRAVEYFED